MERVEASLIPSETVPAPTVFQLKDAGGSAGWVFGVADLTGEQAVVGGVGPFGEDVIEITSPNDGGIQHFLKKEFSGMGVFGEIAGLEIVVRFPESGYANVQDAYACLFQGAAPDPTKIVSHHLGICADFKSQMWAPDEWRRIICLRKGWPLDSEVGGFNWAAEPDGIGFILSAAGPESAKFQFASIRVLYYVDAHATGFAIFFDHAKASAYDQALYALARGVGVGISIIPEKMGRPGYMSIDQIRVLYGMGAEVWPTIENRLHWLSQASRCSELSRTKTWAALNGFHRGSNHFVLPIEFKSVAGFPSIIITEPQCPDASIDDVRKYFGAARSFFGIPGSTFAVDPYRLPCLMVTTETPVALAEYRDWAAASPGRFQFFSFREFWAAASDRDNYRITDFQTFIDDSVGVASAPPSALLAG